MGFPQIWCHWVKECIPSPTFSVLINGTPTGFITSTRGLRQGYPLSPFLFSMALEFFSIHMHLATESGRIHPLKRNVELHVSHLLFADDMLVFYRADKSSVHELNKLLEQLHLNTGLQVNRGKSKIYFSKSCKYKNELASILGVPISSFPTKYLGLPFDYLL